MKSNFTLLTLAVALATPALSHADLRVKSVVPASDTPLSVTCHASLDAQHGNAAHRAADNNTPITNPSGTQQQYTESCQGFFSYWGYILPYGDGGLATEIVYDEDKAYWVNPISMLVTDTYIQGTADGEGVTFELPQLLAYSGDMPVYVARMVLAEDDDSVTYVVDPDQNSIHLTDSNGTLTMDDEEGEVIIGAVNANGDWLGYGEYDITLTPFDQKQLLTSELPAGVVDSADEWTLSGDNGGAQLSLSFFDNALWIGGLMAAEPDAWVCGAVDGDQAVIPTPAYLGVDPETRHRISLYPVTSQLSEWPQPGADPYDYTPADENVLTVGAAEITPQCDWALGFMMNGSFVAVEAYRNPVLRPRPADMSPVPAAPVIGYYEEYDPEYGYGDIEFTLTGLNEDGFPLDTQNLYWQLMVNGEPFTFDPEQYIAFPYAMSKVPYDYVDWEDVFGDGPSRTLYFYIPDYDTFGVRCAYEYDGEWYYSATSSVVCVSVKAPQAAEGPVRLYDLTGRPVGDNARGLLIRVAADGTVSKLLR